MSIITDIAILSPLPQDAALDQLNNWLANNKQGPLCAVDTDCAGGGKVFTSHIWAGSYNYLDLSGFEEEVMAASWRYPEEVFVYFDDEVRGEAFMFCPQPSGS